MPETDPFDARCREACAREGWTLEDACIEVPCPPERRQQVRFERFEFEGSDLVRLHSEIGSVEHIEPTRLVNALRLNFGLPHGALAVRRESLVIVDTLFADDADADEIAATVRYLAETADRYERSFFGADRH